MAPWGAFDAAKDDVLRVEHNQDGQWHRRGTRPGYRAPSGSVVGARAPGLSADGQWPYSDGPDGRRYPAATDGPCVCRRLPAPGDAP